MEIVPNLHFSGDCEKAIALYERAFNGERTILLRYKDANSLDAGEQPDDHTQNYIYHAELTIGGRRVMMNDHTEDLSPGMNVSLLVSMDSDESVQAAFDVLRDGAQIITPLCETTYCSCFVSLVDRFGVRWELIKENS